jgi:biopolymer transport protein ExbD
MFSFPTPRRSRRASLTPMIDVVFLLLVFFMLASQFGKDASLPLIVGGKGAAYEGQPRLVQISADMLRLNGVVVTLDGLVDALPQMMTSPQDMIVIQPDDTASLQRLVIVADHLAAAGYSQIAMVE